MIIFDQQHEKSFLPVCRSIGVATLLTAANALFLSGALAQSLGPFFGVDETETEEVDSDRLLPDDFFDTFPAAGAGDIAVEADNLAFDQDRNMVIAVGQVQMSYDGWLATSDRAEYDRTTGDLIMIGNAVVRDPQDVVYTGERIEVTGDFKVAFANALRMQFPSGALIEAENGTYEDDKLASSENGVYSPCGLCVDEHGNTIGWRVRTTKAVINHENKTMYLERPTLELLGTPIATIPFYWMPDPTDPRAPGFRLPQASYAEDLGVIVSVPFFLPVAEDTDFWLTPTLMSRQGGMLDGELTQRLENGSVDVRAAGVYQLDRSAFIGEVGDRDWRGAIHTSATFQPIDDWAFGWSYLAFSDPNFTNDYGFDDYTETNTAFAQHLSENTFFDIRAQEFLQTGANISQADQDEQAVTWPSARLDHVLYLPEQFGQLDISGDFINLTRVADDQVTNNGVTSTYGYEGSKVHGTLEVDWSKEFNQLGGLVATPFLGIRLDAATYDGASVLNPVATSLLSATPIAAIDLRYPFLGVEGYNSHLFEPIAQLVYRGSSTSSVGVNNDNALGFIFEDSNLFSYNRFSGSDRQETGLRANIGGQYLGNFEDGSWIRFVAGQSFHLAGVNAFSLTDHSLLGPTTGLDGAASYIVAGVNAFVGGGVELGAKVEIDPTAFTISRLGVGAQLEYDAFEFSTNYNFVVAQPIIGEIDDTHEIEASLAVPFQNYWTFTSGGTWDFVQNNWTTAEVDLTYDDEFFTYGGSYIATHDVTSGDVSHYFGFTVGLNGPE